MLNRTQATFYINTFRAFLPLTPFIAKTSKTPPTLLQTPLLMGRQQSSDPTMVSTSIALLQERFRQLQKVKERREEQQLLKIFSETGSVASSTRHFEPEKISFQSDIVLPLRPTPADSSLSLGLNLQTKQVDYYDAEVQPSTNSWLNNTVIASASKNFDNSDLDTSLHL